MGDGGEEAGRWLGRASLTAQPTKTTHGPCHALEKLHHPLKPLGTNKSAPGRSAAFLQSVQRGTQVTRSSNNEEPPRLVPKAAGLHQLGTITRPDPGIGRAMTINRDIFSELPSDCYGQNPRALEFSASITRLPRLSTSSPGQCSPTHRWLQTTLGKAPARVQTTATPRVSGTPVSSPQVLGRSLYRMLVLSPKPSLSCFCRRTVLISFCGVLGLLTPRTIPISPTVSHTA